jgi:hypothetical protein
MKLETLNTPSPRDLEQTIARHIAPPARKDGQPDGHQPITLGHHPGNILARKNRRPKGPQLISLGQRPRNTAPHQFIRPEGATRRTGNIPLRDLEQTIARNVSEILEA